MSPQDCGLNADQADLVQNLQICHPCHPVLLFSAHKWLQRSQYIWAVWCISCKVPVSQWYKRLVSMIALIALILVGSLKFLSFITWEFRLTSLADWGCYFHVEKAIRTDDAGYLKWSTIFSHGAWSKLVLDLCLIETDCKAKELWIFGKHVNIDLKVKIWKCQITQLLANSVSKISRSSVLVLAFNLWRSKSEPLILYLKYTLSRSHMAWCMFWMHEKQVEQDWSKNTSLFHTIEMSNMFIAIYWNYIYFSWSCTYQVYQIIV